MASPETNRLRVVARLSRDGRISEGGAKHEKFAHADKPGLQVLVPRHKILSRGVARNIAKAAGW